MGAYRRRSGNAIDMDAVRAVPIRDIAERLGLDLRPGNKAMCFNGHDRKTPSLSLTPEKNLWYCFGCGSGGNNVSLVQQTLKSLDWREAARWIEREFLHGAGRHFDYPVRMPRGRPNAMVDELVMKPLQYPDPEVYAWILRESPLEDDGMAYLRGRGFTEETIRHFRVGEITRKRNLLEQLKVVFPEERLLRCGVVSRSERGVRFAWSGDFLLFPFLDNDAILYLQGRVLRAGTSGPKYVNLYGVKKRLFNFPSAAAPPRGETVILVEGVMDAMAGHQLGLHAIGVLGASSFDDEWTAPLAEHRIVVIPDNDDAGRSFTQKIEDSFQRRGIAVDVWSLDGAKDLAEFLEKSHEEEVFEK